jgi:flagellar motor switch protein FliN/FliY
MPEIADPPGSEAAKPDQPLVWRQPFSIADGATLWMVAGKDLWQAVGLMILGGAGVDSVTDEDRRSTWNEIAGQTMGGMAGAMSAELGHEIVTQAGGEDTDGPADELPAVLLEVRHDEQVWHVRVAWTSPFAQALVAIAPQPVLTSSTRSEGGVSKTLDLLLDVALPVSVSFGRTSLAIREVLKLNTGSVIELDRLVSEPVDVIVNNCVIARGEVVVVDGNYGVRVIHLASREDRLRSGMSEASARLGTAAG